MHVLMTGATGFVGRHTVAALRAAGHTVTALSRDPANAGLPPEVRLREWNGNGDPPVDGCDAVVNLAGEPVIGRRWNAKQKRRLVESRVLLTAHLVGWARRLPLGKRPKVCVNASAIGYYGANPEGACPEDRAPGEDFLARLCVDWEAAARQAPGRCVIFRFGHVLGRDGGYLARLLPFSRAGLGGPIASGKQAMPWIHVADVAKAIVWAIDGDVEGPFNLCAEVLPQGRLPKELNRRLPLPSLVPIPSLAFRVQFGEAAAVITGGQDARPAKLLGAGFTPRFPTLGSALDDLVGPAR